MRFCLQSFLLWIKQQIRSPKSWIFMLLLPAVVFAAVLLLPEEENSAPVQVGVCLPDTGGEDFWELLTDRSEAVITFCLADEETICAKVATGQWDCGIVLAPDFARSVTRADTDEMIVLYTSTASVVYPLVQEAVSAVVMQMVSPEIASGYAQKIGIGDLESIKKLADSQRVAIQMRCLSGAPLQVQTLTQKSTETLLLGCVALVLLIWCVFRMFSRNIAARQREAAAYYRFKKFFTDRKNPRKLAESIIEQLEVVTPGVNTPVRRLSGGNVQKVLVGREIAAAPKVLMTAYAVRGLDINTSYTIYNLLTEQKMKGVAVIYVGEDLDVLLELCDRILVLCGGKVNGILDARTTTKEEVGLLMTNLQEGHGKEAHE